MKGCGFMSLYGINAYTSNSYYTSLLANRNNSALMNSMSSRNKNSNNLSDMLTNALKTDQNDLYGLAKKVQMLRSPSYQKELIEGFKEYFSGGAASSDEAQSDNAEKLSKSSKTLSEYAGALATGGTALYSDPEKRVSAVKDFVDSYNSTIDDLKSSENMKVLQKGLAMANSSNAYSRTLKRVGISVGSDNKLSLDEGTLKKASENTLYALFAGNYSLAAKIADKASSISRTSALDNQLSYNAKGQTHTDWLNQYFSNSIFSDKV